ncbi:MAG: hypothetical protein K6U04_03790 [Armatimonadetes bacterium]|nr:hypothetical protein [Armatimonadota bacterium]
MFFQQDFKADSDGTGAEYLQLSFTFYIQILLIEHFPGAFPGLPAIRAGHISANGIFLMQIILPGLPPLCEHVFAHPFVKGLYAIHEASQVRKTMLSKFRELAMLGQFGDFLQQFTEKVGGARASVTKDQTCLHGPPTEL